MSWTLYKDLIVGDLTIDVATGGITTTGDVTCDTLNYTTLNPPIDLSGYLDIPCVNSPLTGNLEISKAEPELRLTDIGNSEYARLTRADTSNEFNILNRVRRNSGGYALVFNGSGWISNLDNFTDGLSEFSISLWAYPTTLSDYDGLFSSQWVNNNVSFRLYEGATANQQLTAQVPIGTDYASVGSTAGTFTINNWHHVVVTWKSGEPVALYINNVKKEGSTKTGTLTTTNSPLIGYDSSNSARKFVGTIDQLECWNRQLTDAEVSTLYNSGSGAPYEATDLPWSSGCIRSWNMDENTGTTITDAIASDVGDFTGSGTTWGAGKVAGSYTMVEQSVLQSRTGGNENDEGVVTLGYSGSYGSKTVINGRYINFDLVGTTQFSMDTSGDLVFPDAQYTYFGTGKDYSIGFNATDAVHSSLGKIHFQTDGDTDDYLTIGTTSNVPQLYTTGACDLAITANSKKMTIGNMGAGTGYGGISWNPTPGLTTYHILSSGTTLFLNVPTAGVMYFREANATMMSLYNSANYSTWSFDLSAGAFLTAVGEFVIQSGTNKAIKFRTNGANERLTIESDGELRIAVDGTSGAAGCLSFGAGQDGEIFHSGSIFNIRSDLVTATDSLLLRGGTNGIDFFIGADEQITLTDGKLAPTTDNDISFGDSTHNYSQVYSNGYNVGATAGIDTTFLDADGNTITVTKGIITAKTAP